jgi:hypothetical protein
MNARLDVEDLLGLQTGDAHIIRNAGGVVTEDVIRGLVISHHLLDTNEIVLIHRTRCGMLAFTDDLLKAGLEGDPAAERLLGQATGRAFVSCGSSAATPATFHAFRGQTEPLDAPRDAKNTDERAGCRDGARVHLRRGHGEAGRGELSRVHRIHRLTGTRVDGACRNGRLRDTARARSGGRLLNGPRSRSPLGDRARRHRWSAAGCDGPLAAARTAAGCSFAVLTWRWAISPVPAEACRDAGSPSPSRWSCRSPPRRHGPPSIRSRSGSSPS